MPHAVRCSALSTAIALLAACPAPAPRSDDRREPNDRRIAEPAAEPGPAPAPAPSPAPTPAEPVPEAASPPGPAAIPLPPALAAEGVRPVVRSLWHALEGVDAGDAAAIAHAMTEDARWYPPGRNDESVRGAADLERALRPWSNPTTDIDVRRIIDPGDGPFAAQVSAASRQNPALRHELMLLVETRGDHVIAVHHFGDPLGPVRLGQGEQEPLELGPVGEPVLERGAGEAAQLDVARTLATALDARDDDAVRAVLAEDVVLHDVIARRTRRGRDGYVAGMREMLGQTPGPTPDPIQHETGHLALDRHLAGPRFVVVTGVVFGRKPPPEAAGEPKPQEHGFADVHRMVDGTIAETWHYVNRRGRPRVRP